MKNKELIELYDALIKMNYDGVKFGYFVARNISILGTEIDNIKKTIEVSAKYTEYDKKRVELAEKFADKDKEGKPIVENNSYKITDLKSFEKEFEKVKKENKEVIDARMKQIDDYEKMLEEKSDVKAYKIKQENLPVNINTMDLRAIFNLIEE